jgi:hypothetical protein
VIPVTFDPTQLQDPQDIQWWTDWSRRAEAATTQALDAFETWLQKNDGSAFKFKFNEDIWGDLKRWLRLNVFHRKCAYCERWISGSFGDAEHYRPKAAVQRKNDKGRLERVSCRIDDPMTGAALQLGHPGYFWLAYDWRNLVPACQFCNSGHGKNDRFDVGIEYVVLVRLTPAAFNAIPNPGKPLASRKWPGYYYLAPASLDTLERPLLLNPLNPQPDRNPRKHIRFGVRGIEAAVDDSQCGLNSIETFQLASEELRQDRQEAQDEFRNKYYDAMRRFDPNNAAASEAKALLDKYERGSYPFSAAALDYWQILRAAQPGPHPIS